jgi:uncharacterized phage protein (TIGR02218 family)
MKNLTAEQLAVLASGRMVVADLLTFYFASPIGTKRWTTGDFDITYSGNTWTCSPQIIGRLSFRSALGVEVASLNAKLTPGSSLTLGSKTALAAAVSGAFDGVRVTVERAYMSVPGTLPNGGPVMMFDGNVSEARPGTTEIELVLRSKTAKLDIQLPRRIFQVSCPYRLYDPNTCGVNEVLFTSTATVQAGSTSTSITVNAAQAVGYWKLGTITIGTDTRSILESVDNTTTHTLKVSNPFPTGVVTAGATATLKRGCDKSRDTCRNTFNNVAIFGGWPDAPRAETLTT